MRRPLKNSQSRPWVNGQVVGCYKTQAYFLESPALALWILLWPDLRNPFNRKGYIHMGKRRFFVDSSVTLTSFLRTVLLHCSRKFSASFLTLVWRESPGFLNLHQGFLFVGEWLSCSLALEWFVIRFFFQPMYRWTSVGTGLWCFAIPASKGGGRCKAGSRPDSFPYFKHLIVHLLNILCTDIGQIINLFLYLFFFFFTKTVFT